MARRPGHRSGDEVVARTRVRARTRAPGHRDALALLRERALVAQNGEAPRFSFPSTEQQWHHDTLAKLVRDLETFFAPASGLVAGVRKRLAFAESVERLTLFERRDEWKAAIDGIAAAPAYRGLRIAPQLGLVPLGRDPASGLFEFAHLQTGAVPVRNAEGKLAFDATTAMVLVLIPGGTFRMGAPGPGEADLDPDGPGMNDPRRT